MKRYLKDWQNIIFASMLYCFSGTVFFNMNYHFLDSYALIPLLFWALDKAVLERRKGYLAITATMLLMTNFMFFYSAVIFLAIYFVVKIITKEYIIDRKLFLSLAFESVVSVLICSTIVFRAVLPTFLNPKLFGGTEDISGLFTYSKIFVALLLSAFTLPADTLHNRTLFGEYSNDLPSVWLPVVGIVLAASYLIRNRDKFGRILISISVIIASIPILNAVFSLSPNNMYPRWYIYPVLFLSLYSAEFFETKKRISPLWGAAIPICAALIIYSFKANWPNTTFVVDRERALIYLAIAAGSLIVTVLLGFYKNRKVAVALLTFAVIGVSALLGNIYVKLLTDGFTLVPHYGNVEAYFFDSENAILPDDEYIRYDHDLSYTNIGVLTDSPTVNIFSSTIHNSINEYRLIINGPNSQLVTLRGDHKTNFGYQTLASVKYIAENIYNNTDVYLPNYFKITETAHYDIYGYPYYIPMGFTFDSYITTEELLDIEIEDRDLALLKALVIDEDIEAMLPKADTAKFDYSFESFEIDVENRKEQTADVFYEIKNGFYSEIELESDNIVFFSVPYDEGFSATVNGEEAEIYKVQGGFIGIPAGAGANIIEFVYTPPTLILEIILMVLGVVALMIYIFFDRLKKRCLDGQDRE